MPEKALRAIWYWLARWGCRIFCILFFKFRVYGRENVPKKGGFLLVSNHQSYLDPVLCGAALNRTLSYLARDTLFSNRYFAKLIYSLNAIPVKRGEADLSAMREVIARLRAGCGVCLFPEATRTCDGRIIPLRAGFGVLARRAGAAVVPTVIDGAFEAWPRNKRMFSPGGHIIVHYGRAITADKTKVMDDQELARVITERLRRMQAQTRVRHGKEPRAYT